MQNKFLNSNKVLSEQFNLLRYAVVIEYNGTNFAGSQIQPECRTVQGEIESTLKILMQKEIKTTFSGRTDSGVHAKAQVLHFDIATQLDTARLINSMNSLLPPDISVSSITKVGTDFHAQKSSKKKHYRYTINNASQRSVWSEPSLHCRMKLDVDAMQKALAYIEGEHDFTSFRSSKTLNPARICTIHRAECTKEGDVIYIDLIGNRFLYNMVRIIVGSIIEIGRGEQSPEWMKEILEAQDRNVAGPTAAAIGLSLISVSYKENKNMNNSNKEAPNENLLCKAS